MHVSYHGRLCSTLAYGVAHKNMHGLKYVYRMFILATKARCEYPTKSSVLAARLLLGRMRVFSISLFGG